MKEEEEEEEEERGSNNNNNNNNNRKRIEKKVMRWCWVEVNKNEGTGDPGNGASG